MIDTIKIRLSEEDFDINIIKGVLRENLHPVDEKMFRGRYKPTGMVRNMAVYIFENKILINGSIAKFANRNNVENFNWKHLKFALLKLSDELGGINLDNAKISRIDVGVNIGLEDNIENYFPELFYLHYYQRVNNKKTTLRFFGNSVNVNFLLYDKLADFRKKEKLLNDDLSFLTMEDNLMRIEIQMQERVSQYLKMTDFRVKHLYDVETCKLLLRKWFDLYNKIEKKPLLIYPIGTKGLPAFEMLMKKYIIVNLGWERLKYLLKKGVDNRCISPSDKSKKLYQFKIAMSEIIGFDFENKTKELNHKVKVMYVEGLKQIYRMP